MENIFESRNYVNACENTWRKYSSDMRRIRGLVEHLDTPGSLMLDVGCGTGRMRDVVCRARYMGVDGSTVMVSRCKERGIEAYGPHSVYDLGALSDSEADVVLCHAVCCHIADVPRAVKELWRVTKSRLIVSMYYSWWPRHRGVRPTWVEGPTGGWFQPQNKIPAWMIYRIAQKLKPARYQVILTKNETHIGDRLAYLVMDR